MKLATLTLLLLSCCVALAETPERVIITLDVPADAREEVWSRALTVAINGDGEVVVPFGRADVVTADFAIEVDRIVHFHAAIGQALHYSDALQRKPVVAFITPAPEDEAKLVYIERMCARLGVEIWLLCRSSKFALPSVDKGA